MHDLVVDDVVGDRQQRADEGLVTAASFGGPGFAIDRGIGQLLRIEAALRAGRDDHSILDPLRFHQAEDFGAEVVAPVGPAQATARHRAAAQMDSFDASRIDEDFAIGDRFRQVRHLGRIDLESERLGCSRGKGVGAQDRVDQRIVEPQQAVVIDRLDLGQPALDRRACLFDRLVATIAEFGIVPRGEQRDQRARYIGRGRQCIDHRIDGEAHARLAQIAIERAQPVGLARGEPGLGHQAVERIVLGLAIEHGGERFLDRAGALDQSLGIAPRLEIEQEVVDRAQPTVVEHGGHFGPHIEPEVFKRGNTLGQGQAAL